LVGVALFSSEEAHRFVIFDIQWTIHDVDHFALGADGVTGIDVLGNLFEVAVLRVPITLDLSPNLVIRIGGAPGAFNYP
jgi:hypothetical protein